MAERQLEIKQSSQVDAAHYDPDTQTMRVHYKSGGIYTYHGLSEETALGLESADSPGRYLNLAVKGQHEYRKIG